MPIEYRSGQISTYRNLPERTKTQIRYIATHMGLTRGAAIAAAMDAFMAKFAAEGRLPEALAKLALGQGGPADAGTYARGCNPPGPPIDADVEAYLRAVTEAAPTEKTADDLAFEQRLAERRAVRDAIMGRIPGGSRA